MGTRTAIFQEQTNGGFLGIYIHLDGDIEGVGRTLFENYSDKQKTAQLLNKKRFLSSLGTTAEIISSDESFEMYKSNSKDIKKYCVGQKDEYYFIADSLEVIRNMNYLSYSNGELDGAYSITKQGKEFKPFRGSDNNGYLYVQKLNGQWYVSYYVKELGVKEYEMSEFKPLESVLKKEGKKLANLQGEK